ncbi:uncharacterized protein EI97DRAFT_459553 [Westerdykella ornata]|uniref:Uncharacterized protein n=1 Tax=Westerdykella ornata TaxID=318751 RepID=A0A6A6JHY9_WESOR|nr:uncharacterized protein EI97DRAFT_459553 [Westerdykella ornata]KAF2275256.1 hypothetical protein EI97DRAFT_459553 [Westerdykella ornata]
MAGERTTSTILSTSKPEAQTAKPPSWLDIFDDLINNDAKAPSTFRTGHTAIRLPDHAHYGNWLHISRVLSDSRKTEIETDMRAMWWQWESSVYPPYNGPGVPYRMLPKSFWKLIGPEWAPYPMTKSPVAPFQGPHTALFNDGRHFRGWFMHVPRYLKADEMAIAEENLKTACDQPWDWGRAHGANPVMPLSENDAHRRGVYSGQKDMVTFLKHELHISFKRQEDEYGTWKMDPPLWSKWTEPPPTWYPNPFRPLLAVFAPKRPQGMEYSRPPPELEVLSDDDSVVEENVRSLDQSWAAHDEVYNRLLMPPTPEKLEDDNENDDWDSNEATLSGQT